MFSPSLPTPQNPEEKIATNLKLQLHTLFTIPSSLLSHRSPSPSPPPFPLNAFSITLLSFLFSPQHHPPLFSPLPPAVSINGRDMESPIQFLDNAAWTGNYSNTPLVCYASTMMSQNGLMQSENPLNYTFPLFLFQLMLILLTNRLTAAILHPLRQPRYISEILAGFVLGPTMMGRISAFAMTCFPFRSLVVLESLAYIGLVFFIFIIGIEIDFSIVTRVGRRSAFLTLTCLVGPITIGAFSGLMLHSRVQDGTHRGAFVTFLCGVLCVTAFSVLARILAQLKLIASDVGRLALSAAMIADGVAWVFLIVSIALSQSRGKALAALWAVFSGAVFILVVYLVVRPAARWVQKRTPEGEEVAELYVCVMLVGVMAAAFVADAIGTHAIFGAFVYGLAVPNGPLGEVLIDKIGDFTEGLLLPLFFALSGFRTNLNNINSTGAAVLMLLVVLAAVVAKVAGAVFAAFCMDMPLVEGISLGLLLNTKGVLELIILNIGWDKGVLRQQSFTILVVLSVMVTALVSPLVNMTAKPSRRFVAYKRRTIWWWNPDSELRILACLHSSRDAPSIISLLDISHPTKRSPFFVYSLFLVDLAGRSSTLLVVNSTTSSSPRSSFHESNHHPATAHHAGIGRHQTQSDQITHAFESYEQHAGGVSVQSLTAFSPYPTMHEDVISVAEDKHCALIFLPFHKHRSVDGAMEITHPAIRPLNQSVLSAAPCSVAVLVDRGLASLSQRHRAALLFFGGPDDREAMAYAERLASHPGVALTVVRFLPCDSDSPGQERVVEVAAGEAGMNEECVAQFREASGGEVEYVEKMVSNAEETVAVLREMEGRYDLYIVGRAEGVSSTLTEGLTEWSECPELGAIGDLLASSDFGSTASVLVLQQGKCREEAGSGGGVVMVPIPASPGNQAPAYFGEREWGRR